ncbi:hypothetical protein INT45_002430 [Circinella minor]|uniref:Uncharacterized protein n=1 Tax=Circinella minor TaxID=1195481 RepID=A0A8H7VH64_9FUNG|nr:hypothetical protein INT45_002430 [Circinella minor]
MNIEQFYNNKSNNDDDESLIEKKELKPTLPPPPPPPLEDVNGYQKNMFRYCAVLIEKEKIDKTLERHLQLGISGIIGIRSF